MANRVRGELRRFVRLGAVLSGAVAASAGIEIARRYRRDLERARDRVSRDSRIALTACGPVEYATAGDGPPVLVVHGAGGGFDQGLDFGRMLELAGFRVVAVSRFGYLRSPLPPEASAEKQADAHAALLDELGIGHAAVLGASAGAPSSIQLALRHPDRVDALVLGVPALWFPRPGTETSLRTPVGTRWLFDTALASDFLFWAAIRLARRTLIRSVLGTPPEVAAAAPPEEQGRLDEMLEHILPVAPRRLGLIHDAAVTSNLEPYPLERVGAPTLVVSVEDDLYGTFDPARYSAERIPGARFLGFRTGGHLWVGHHREISSAISGFLTEVRTRNAPLAARRPARSPFA